MNTLLTLLGYVRSALYGIDLQLLVMTFVIALLLWGFRRFRHRNARRLKREWEEALRLDIEAGRLPPAVLQSPLAYAPVDDFSPGELDDPRERAVLVCTRLERLRHAASRRTLALAA